MAKKIETYLSVFFCSLLGMFLGYWIASSALSPLPLAQAQVNENGDVLTLSQLSIVNSVGQIILSIGTAVDNKSPGIWFYDKNGVNRLSIGIYEDNNVYLVLNDEKERAVQILRTYGPDSDPVLVMKTEGRDKIIMGSKRKTNEGLLVHFDSKGTQKSIFGTWSF